MKQRSQLPSPSPRRPRCWREAGYTATELLLVLVLMGVVLVVAIPGIQSTLTSYRVHEARRQIASDLRLAQSIAVSRGQFARVRMDATLPNGYRLERSPDNVTWPALADTTATNAAVLSQWKNLAVTYPGVAMAAPTTVAFSPRGFLAGGGGPVSLTLQVPSVGQPRTMTILMTPAGQVQLP